jgi:hypothetical protein
MQFGLGHRAFEPEQQLIVEIGRIVATVGVDNQGSGQGVGGGVKMLLARRFENVGPNVSAGAKMATGF